MSLLQLILLNAFLLSMKHTQMSSFIMISQNISIDLFSRNLELISFWTQFNHGFFGCYFLFKFLNYCGIL
uniref:Putative secreted protein n=1 Tax=Xenopsylla cheopis TaxID=163159 RepID=A0A6M2E0F0_XENCH